MKEIMKEIHSPATLAERLGVESTSTSPSSIDSNSSDIGRELFGFFMAASRYTATMRSPSLNSSSGLFRSLATGKRACVTPEGATPESPGAPMKQQRILDYTSGSEGLSLFAATDWPMEDDTINNVSEAFRTPVNQGILSVIPNAPRALREQQTVILFPPFGDDVAENNIGFVTPQ